MDTVKLRKIRQRILLISPYAHGLEDITSYPPLGLLYIASNLNIKYTPDILIMESPEFNKYDYEVYGISVHSVGVVKFVSDLICKIHQHNPDATILVGGAGAKLIPKADYILRFIGEAERYFDVDTSNLDNIKFPARYLVPDRFIKHEGKVHHANEPSTTMIATRGCPYQCTFCDKSVHGTKFRKRSVDNVMQEIRQIKKFYNINWIRFIDDCITIDKKWFAELCLELGNEGTKWTVLSRADCVDPKLLKLMKKSGCQEIFFGFETGSQKLLNKMKKKTTVEANANAVKMCKDAGIISCAYMLFGFPGENQDTVDDTISFLEESKPDKSRISQYLPIPDSDVWNNPNKYNVIIKDNWEDYWYFDRDDFPLIYSNMSETGMKDLRKQIKHYYDVAGYTHGWKGQTCLTR